MDKALRNLQKNKANFPFPGDKSKSSPFLMNRKQSSAGKQISTMRLKEGYHPYRKPDAEVLEIGDEDFASSVPFIYDAAYPQNERDMDGNKPNNKASFFSSVNNGFTPINRGNNKAPSERSSGHHRSATAKCIGRLRDIITCRRYAYT